MQSKKLEKVFRRTGLVLINSGALLFLFAIYQLFGTALITAQAQNNLENDLDAATEELASDEFIQNTFTKLETITVSEDIERTETVETEYLAPHMKISLLKRYLPLALLYTNPKERLSPRSSPLLWVWILLWFPEPE